MGHKLGADRSPVKPGRSQDLRSSATPLSDPEIRGRPRQLARSERVRLRPFRQAFNKTTLERRR